MESIRQDHNNFTYSRSLPLFFPSLEKALSHCLRNKILSRTDANGVKLTEPIAVEDEISAHYVGGFLVPLSIFLGKRGLDKGTPCLLSFPACSWRVLLPFFITESVSVKKFLFIHGARD